MVTICSLKKSEIPELKGLLGLTWVDTYGSLFPKDIIRNISDLWHSDSFIENEINDPNSLFTVAKNKSGQIIGALMMVFSSDRSAFIKRIYVHPDCQRKGIGSELLKNALGSPFYPDKVFVEVEEENLKGMNFYKKYGFKRVGSKKKDIEGTKFEIALMEKRGLWDKLI